MNSDILAFIIHLTNDFNLGLFDLRLRIANLVLH